MSPLARLVYKVLRAQALRPEPRITYAALAAEVRLASPEFESIYHRSRELYAALNEVGRECRRLRLPSLPALVVRADTGRPGAAYFDGKCSGTLFRGQKVAAWRREVEAVKGTTYPRR